MKRALLAAVVALVPLTAYAQYGSPTYPPPVNQPSAAGYPSQTQREYPPPVNQPNRPAPGYGPTTAAPDRTYGGSGTYGGEQAGRGYGSTSRSAEPVGAPMSREPSPENCGTPDEPKACPPMPRRAARY
jgi:hypothetical protein